MEHNPNDQPKKRLTKAQKNALRMNADLKKAAIQGNQILSESGLVKGCFLAHVIDIERGITGVETLIEYLMVQHNAIDNGNDNDNARNGLFTFQIHIKARAFFSKKSLRYPRKTILDYLSRNMTNAGKIVRLRSNECDKNRTCSTTRIKWLLTQEAAYAWREKQAQAESLAIRAKLAK